MYCNYSQDKFDNEITFIIPSWLPNLDTFSQDEKPQEGTFEYNYYTLRCALEYVEEHYFALLNNGCSPQQARQVLPNALKTEIVVTGFISDWKHFFDLRYFGTTGKPHPDMFELSTKAKTVLEEAGLWSMITNSQKLQHRMYVC